MHAPSIFRTPLDERPRSTGHAPVTPARMAMPTAAGHGWGRPAETPGRGAAATSAPATARVGRLAVTGATPVATAAEVPVATRTSVATDASVRTKAPVATEASAAAAAPVATESPVVPPATKTSVATPEPAVDGGWRR
ncbi:hypothetical protein GCM10023321_74660 [Pseudonocardia eucalypti]|uniref:Uncharacterized protein n=1 Tax=Pseudonocardia eucalypti TaxID=648755 RepID=A0ABP9R998_9PSEU|nr:hypothetical protein [Pseudonocardia eucalypti]